LANPGGFDYQAWLLQQGIDGVGYVIRPAEVLSLSGQRWQLDSLRWRLGRWFAQRYSQLPASGLFAALLWADRQGISTEQWELFQHTGTIHLMVISGLHVGLVATLVFFLGRTMFALFLLAHPERYGACLAIFAAASYALLAGLSLPTQRALVMVVVFMWSIICHRQLKLGQGLLLALLICLLLDPIAAVSASFWLSFVAVAVILLVNFGRQPRMGRWRQLWRIQWAIFIGLLPFLSFFNGQISLLAPLCNLIAVPVFSVLLVPGLLLALLLELLQLPFASALWQLLDQLLAGLLLFLNAMDASLGHWQASLAIGSGGLLVLATIGVLVCLLPLHYPLRVLGLTLLLPLFIKPEPVLGPGDLRITVFDAGQGLSLLIKTASRQLIYDLGAAFGERFSIARQVVIPNLRDHGLDYLDRLVISHSDSDHSGDWTGFEQRFTVQQIDSGEEAFFPARLGVNGCRAGQNWQWDGVRFEYLHPLQARSGSSSNNRSCVLKVSTAGQSVLIPGDIERSVELDLVLRYGSQLQASVLIAPHHGSSTSSSWPWVKTVRPDAVVFAVGYKNRFGHPKAEVLERYRQFDAEIYRSDTHGAISFELRKGEWLPVRYQRQHKRHYWQ
jgi:competence protein ComEC